MAVPPEILELMKRTSFDPGASRGYEHFSGGFYWSDEFAIGHMEIALGLNDFTHRFLIAHRSAIILGRNVQRFLALWQEVEQHVPGWPGLRPERRDPALTAELVAKHAEVAAGLDELDRTVRRIKH